MTVTIFRYSGNPIDNTALLSRLGIEGDHTYLVATLAMEHDRRLLAPAHQRDADGRPQLVFHKALRHWLCQRHVPLLTRAEERVALLRAAEQIAQNPDLARQLRHDVFAWRDALADLAARGVDASAGLPPELEAQLVNTGVGALLLQLQSTYQTLQRRERRKPFEDAASAYLAGGYVATSYVIFEGFTFFTPLQRRLIDVIDAQGKNVILIYPYRAEQAYGFKIMDTTYGDWLDNGVIVQDVDTTVNTPADDLRALQEALFSSDMTLAHTGDGSVMVAAYGHRHQEVSACVRRLRELIDGGVSPKDIAIVTRNAGNIEALLHEEAALQDLPVSLSVPPRLLLLTPLGRFVLALYESWDAGSLRVSAEQMETMLASGWLGADVQATADLFSAVRAQFFARCVSQAEWEQSFAQLLQARAAASSPRLVARLVHAHTVALWQRALDRVRALCERLFASGHLSIGGHVRRLLDEINQFAPEQMREAEREVLTRIEQALMEVASAASMEMSPAEFGGVLNSLVREYQRPEGEEGETMPPEPDTVPAIWVTTPEGIDGRERDYILYLGVDSQRTPRAYAEAWPFYERRVDKHQQQERYLFLAVVRAARRRLTLSYARVDEDATLRPSPYLEEVCHLLNLDLSLPETLPVALAEDTVRVVVPALRARRSTYTLSEIAHAGLCPYRYKLERLSPAGRVYRDSFQIHFLAQGHWLNLIMSHLRTTGQSALGIAPMHEMFREAMEATRQEVEQMFPGLRALDWHTIEQYVAKSLHYVVEQRGENGRYPLSVVPSMPTVAIVTDGDRTISVDAELRHNLQIGKYNKPFFDDLLFEEWLLPGATPQANQSQSTELADGSEVFASLDHAVIWWRNANNTIFSYYNIQNQQARTDKQHSFFEDARQNYIKLQADLRTRIALIETGRYPKHPGDHCRYCPVRLDCLGIEP